MTRVAIIGGGIGGLTAAIALSRAGIEVAVYEAAAELREIGAGVALYPNAMRVLRAIGAEDGVRKIAGRSEWQVLRNGMTGRLISRTNRKEQAASFGVEGATAHRADMLDVLASLVGPGVVSLGKRCVSVDSGTGDAGVAVARFADGSEAEADIIVGADGIHSVVRTALFGQDAPRFTAIVLYPLRGEELINVVAHYDDDSYRHESWVERCERAEVLDRYAGWHESLLRLLRAGDTWYKWALYDRDPIPAWTRGRVTLLGDAAHPMLPYLGQGACQAIEDGAVLATALAASSADPVAGLGRYERTRRPRASRVVLTARERGLSQPPDLAVRRLAARPRHRVAQARSAARPRGPRHGVACRVRRDLTGCARGITERRGAALWTEEPGCGDQGRERVKAPRSEREY